jgi:hypothetical protein
MIIAAGTKIRSIPDPVAAWSGRAGEVYRVRDTSQRVFRVGCLLSVDN